MSTNRPTTMNEAEPAEQFDDLNQQNHANLMGMWLFLATELLLFGGLFAGFAVFRILYPESFGEAASHLSVGLGVANTVVLFTSGLTTKLADDAVESRRRGLGLALLLATIVLGSVFLVIKGFEWHHEYEIGLMPVLGLPFEYPGPDPQNARLFFNFYYAMTGLHAAHMIIGLGLLGVIAALLYRWRDPPKIARQVRISGLYWAFVDVIWVFVFTFLYLLRG